jgi:arylsulfatase A-like enzyme
MKAIVVMFDSLNRHMLPPYGCDWTHAPNFKRLARRSITFDRSYVCSMPCMPARRDLHTARPSLLHCGWGPLEPFDDSIFNILRDQRKVYSHLATDHYHYFEDGGATYHNRYDSWEFFRGQEGDPFIGQVADPVIPPNINGKSRREDWVNRMHIRSDEQYPQSKTFQSGVAFIDRNANEDNWLLHIECFDPHEPFTCDRRWRDLYPSPDDPKAPLFDWPDYAPVKETPQQVQQARHNYAALLSKCDASLGDVLDAMDRHDLWKDTLLIVCTDHGFMLGEHNCWAKNWMPLYEEVSHTPFFVWDPRCGKANQRRNALVQPMLDIGPTLLDFFGAQPTADMLGKNLRDTIANDAPVRDVAIFGYHGMAVNVTDGRHVYMRQPVMEDGEPIYNYTLMPTAMRGFKFKYLRWAHTVEPFSFTKGQHPLKLGNPNPTLKPKSNPRHLLFDLETDPQQEAALDDPARERIMIDHLTRLMRQCDAPPEQYVRLGLSPANQGAS